jgi:acyl-coenzyme A synthetase/AMP-(fatty) acid ligase
VASYDEDGVFYQVDRAVDAIETESGTGYSVLMEVVLLGNVPEICDCGVVAGRQGDQTVAVALVRTTSANVDVDRVLEAANDALRTAGHPGVALIEVARTDAEYPVGVTGKVLKRVLRERYDDLESYVAADAERVLGLAS